MADVNEMVDGAADQVEGHAKAVGKTFTKAAQDVAAKASDAWSKAKDAGQRTSEVVAEQYGRVSQSAQDVYGQTRDKAVEWEEDFEGFVRRRPLTAVLTGVGVGLLIGIALNSRK